MPCVELLVALPQLSYRDLEYGSMFIEPSPAIDSETTLRLFHYGKEDSMSSVFSGGNGFPLRPPSYDDFSWTVYDAGAVNERRDLRSWLHWDRSLSNCQLDAQKGVNT